jgi:hypothetical protein
MVLEGERPAVNTAGQDAPDDQHQQKPQKRKYQKRDGLYFLQRKQYCRGNGKYIDQYQ